MWASMWGSVVIFRSQMRPASKKFGKHCARWGQCIWTPGNPLHTNSCVCVCRGGGVLQWKRNNAFRQCCWATCHCPLSAAQQCFHGKSVSPATIHCTQIFMYSVRCCTETKDCSFALGLLQTYNLAIQIVMTGKSPRSFSVLVSAAYNIVHTSDGTNQLWSNICWIMRVCLYLYLSYPACKSRIFWAVSYVGCLDSVHFEFSRTGRVALG